MKAAIIPVVALSVCLCQCQKKEPSEESAGPKPEMAEPKLPRSRIPQHVDRMEQLRESMVSAEDLPEGPERTKALSAVAWNALELDPDLSLELLDELPAGSRERVRLVGHLSMRLAEGSAQEAATWAASLAQPEERQEAFSRITVIMANDDPVGAAKLLFEEVEEGRARDRSTVQIIQRWSQSEPAAAAEWIETFPDGRLRSAALRSCLDPWIKLDPAAAARWICGLSEIKLREQAASIGKPIVLRQPPSAQNEFMNAVNDPEVRRTIR